ncbi:hypothetical protein [Streptomyces hiroshimensis]|uniref:Holin n=1 Tax=Streptomyces hiroshimensis TaxID=66424 RepID=A0ABQ2Z398_9ACTN|nr:hypothetical protein [Streptomyces hiroshimensis]GGY03634.1 hypothetical protein GCM10010324_58190 [Streptomyces hiroshimensis]
MSGYSDVQKAVRAEKRQIWCAWVSGGIVMAVIANATRDIAVVSAITEALFLGLGILATLAAVRMTSALNRKDEAARREVLDDI